MKYEGGMPPGLINGEWRMENGEWAGAKTTLRKNLFKNSCNLKKCNYICSGYTCSLTF
jgi:hypothetical protein